MEIGTNTYIIGTGRQRLLVDTGEGKPSWIAALRDTLHKENATISKALITHWHHDHTGGIKQLLELSPDTKIYKNTAEEGQEEIKDGQVFSVEGAVLRAVFSPGHTEDHIALILEEEDAMFTGDNVLGQGTAVFEDLLTYIKSLEKMKTMFKGRAYPGHGPVIRDGPATISEYIQHRQQREDQVIKVLKSDKHHPDQPCKDKPDEWASMEAVKIIYRDVPEDLHDAANRGVLQILHKLKAEGKIIEIKETQKWCIKQKAVL
jgi:glyoxylase-like metal-dependent hydrolase (beta-lactamase superfamily II)